MDDFEQQLSRSLRRKDPPPDFAGRVLSRIDDDETAGRLLRFGERPVSRGRIRFAWLAAACILVAAMITVIWSYTRQPRKQPEPREATRQMTRDAVPHPPPSRAIPHQEKTQDPSITNQHDLASVSRKISRPRRSSTQARARAEGLRAKRELIAALYVASEKLNFAESRVRHAMSGGRRAPEDEATQQSGR